MRPTIATILALTATAALAPTPAAAVINNSGTAGCAAPHPGDQIYWNGGSWCAIQEGAGGTAATGTGAGSPGIFFWAQSDAPKDLLTECLRSNAGACVPTQRGGREVQEAKDGPIAGARGGTGSKAGKSETGRGKQDKLTRGLCKMLLEAEDGALLPTAVKDLAQIRRELDELRSKALGVLDQENELIHRKHVLEDRLARVEHSLGKRSADRHPYIFELEDQISEVQKKINDSVAERSQLSLRIDAGRTREAKVLADGAREAKAALWQCGALYGGWPR